MVVARCLVGRLSKQLSLLEGLMLALRQMVEFAGRIDERIEECRKYRRFDKGMIG